MEAVIGSCFTLGKKIGNGAFGTIFEGTCKQSKRKVAIKLERARKRKPSNLEIEYKVLKHLQGDGKQTEFLWDSDL